MKPSIILLKNAGAIAKKLNSGILPLKRPPVEQIKPEIIPPRVQINNRLLSIS